MEDTIPTVKTEHGDKTHIVVDEAPDRVTVACGHVHFTGPIEEYDSLDEIDELCSNCEDRHIKRRG